MSYTLDKYINCQCSLAIFDFQVSVKAAILSGFIDSCIGDAQHCAEKSRSTAVSDGEASAGRRGRPPQVLPTSARRKHVTIKGREPLDERVDGKQQGTYLHVSSRLSDLFILWVPWMFSVGGSGMNRSSKAGGTNSSSQRQNRLGTVTSYHPTNTQIQILA